MECYLVKDIMPTYIDGLVSDETEKDIKLHLESCPDCQLLYEQMTAPIDVAPLKSKKDEINFLLKIKKKTIKTVVKSIAITLLAVIVVFGAFSWIFAIGTKVNSEDVTFSTSIEWTNFDLRNGPNSPVPEDTQIDREWVIRFELNNGKALRAKVEPIYGEDAYSVKTVTGQIVTLYEVQPSALLYESSQYSYGYGYANARNESDDVHLNDDIIIIIRFQDKEMVYSMNDEGLFEINE